MLKDNRPMADCEKTSRLIGFADVLPMIGSPLLTIDYIVIILITSITFLDHIDLSTVINKALTFNKDPTSSGDYIGFIDHNVSLYYQYY